MTLGPCRAPRPRVDHDVAAATVVVVGPGDQATADQVARWIHALVGGGARRLVVDVSAVRGCDGRLLTVLARARAELVDRGGVLEVTGVALPQFLGALQAAAPDEAFVVYDAVRNTRSRAG